MIKFETHRGWILCAAAGLIFAGSLMPLTDLGLNDLHHKTQTLTDQAAADQQELVRLQQDVAASKNISLSPEQITALLQPAERAVAATMIEQTAVRNNLEHFTYVISPPESFSSEELPTGLSRSEITLSADASEDLALLTFLKELPALLPGRISITALHIEPLVHDAQAPVSVLNLHMEAHVHWIANANPEGGAK